MVVFKPQVNEIITGKVVAQNEKGVFASVGMATVFIPASNLHRPSYL
jgi:DNA-directed RNA polymerase subunit E'/Rpb7